MVSLKNPFTATNVIMIVIIAITGIYLWSQFTGPGTGTCTPTDVEKGRHGCINVGDSYDTTEFVLPETEQLETSTLWIIRLMIVGGAVFLGYLVVMKFAGLHGRLGKKDIFMLIMLAIAVYFVWEYIIIKSGFLTAQTFKDLTLDQIGKNTLMKFGQL